MLMANGMSIDAVPPIEAIAHGKDTDIENDLSTIWSIARATGPQFIMELGTRRAISTRTLRHAAPQAKIIAIDPDQTCALPLSELESVIFQCMTGEEYLTKVENGSIGHVRAELIFIDTDPHTYNQTKWWLDHFVPTFLAPGGYVLFHDIIKNRPEIQVREAIEDWIETRPNWNFKAFPIQDRHFTWPQGGLGLLYSTDPGSK